MATYLDAVTAIAVRQVLPYLSTRNPRTPEDVSARSGVRFGNTCSYLVILAEQGYATRSERGFTSTGKETA